MRLASLLLALFLPVASLAAQAVWTVSGTPIVDIASADANGNVVFQTLGGATRLSNGNFLVVDRGSTSIRVIDSKGKLIRNVGREGSGPGEYRIIISGNGCGNDSLLVWARETSVMVGQSGDAARTFKIPADSARLRPLRAFSCTTGGSIVYLTQPLSRPVQNAQGNFDMLAAAVLADREGKVIMRADPVPAGEWMPVPRGAFPRPLGPTSTVVAVGDRIVLGYSDSSRVWVIQPSGQKSVVRIPYTPRAPTPQEFKDAVSAIADMAPPQGRAMIEPELAKATMPATLPPYFDLFGDPDGVLWVQQSPPGAKRTDLLAMSLDGKVLARTIIPMPLLIYEIGREHVIGTYDDANGETHLAVFSLRRR